MFRSIAQATSRHVMNAELVGYLSRMPVAIALLVGLCLFCYLPGVVLLPPVDRTEVIFAETVREMVARAAWLDPRYGDTVHQYHPVGAYWAQGLAASLFGSDLARNISVYRIPSLVAVTLATLALFWLSLPVVGVLPALLAAALFAVCPLTVLVAHLAIADGPALLFAVVAMLALMRIYVGREEDQRAPCDIRLGLLLWAAVGLGMLVNALQIPIMIGIVAAALSIADRDVSWLKRTRPEWGLPLALGLAAPWLVVRAAQDGVPYAGLDTWALLDALSGSQNMKHRAFPGTFVLALLLGFLPGLAVLPDALKKLWDERAGKLAKFLLAWIVVTIVFLEVFSAKPGTYAVQSIFPALALAVAMLGGQRDLEVRSLRWSMIPPPILGVALLLALLVPPYAFSRELPGPLAVALCAGVVVLAAAAGRAEFVRVWLVLSIATFGLYAATMVGVVLPSVKLIWPTRQIATVAAACDARPVWVVGFREPSTVFSLKADRRDRNAMPADPRTLHVVESRSRAWHDAEMGKLGVKPVELGCVEGYNTMRGCPLTFTIFARDPQQNNCRLAPQYACSNVKTQLRPSSKACD